MQGKYVSLDPQFAQSYKQTVVDREQVYAQRCNEAKGGDAAINAGILAGMLASTYAYSKFYESGFRVLPICATKKREYVIIFGSTYLSYLFGKTLISVITGDVKQKQYLQSN